jgi:hypothetical protein
MSPNPKIAPVSKHMSHPKRSAEDWYHEAARYYVEGHQACAWCGSPHQVYKVNTATGVEYQCNRCDFHAGYDQDLDRYRFIAGDKKAAKRAPLTMHGC